MPAAAWPDALNSSLQPGLPPLGGLIHPMCGINGIVGPYHESCTVRQRIERMADVLRHRGPDGSGYSSPLKATKCARPWDIAV
jgi:hypothetical protein